MLQIFYIFYFLRHPYKNRAKVNRIILRHRKI